MTNQETKEAIGHALDGLYRIGIRRNSDGVIRTHTEETWDEFQWTVGNYGCDCNRQILFDGGMDMFGDMPCNTVAYSIVRVIAPDGAVIYSE